MGLLDRISVPAEQLFTRACERNAPIELYLATPKGSRLVGRSRMIRFSGEFLDIDSIQYADDQPRLKRDAPLELFFTLDDSRYTGPSILIESNVRMDLNERKHVYGVRLKRPQTLKSAQRRDCYRVELGTRDAIAVNIHDTDSSQPDCCPRTALRIAGQIFDISQNGIGVRVSSPDVTRLQRCAMVYASFTLPIHDGDQHYLAEVRHVRPAKADGQFIVGLAFHACPDVVYMRRLDNALQRFVVEKQREALRRAG